jgi:HTH-type transcriptional regulator, competence development regulator
MGRDTAKSLRQLARELEVQPAYISQVERDKASPPSEDTIRKWAQAIEEDPDVLLAMAGKVSSDLRQAIIRRPVLFAQLIRELKDAPDHAVLRIVREVRDGEW